MCGKKYNTAYNLYCLLIMMYHVTEKNMCVLLVNHNNETDCIDLVHPNSSAITFEAYPVAQNCDRLSYKSKHKLTKKRKMGRETIL